MNSPDLRRTEEKNALVPLPIQPSTTPQRNEQRERQPLWHADRLLAVFVVALAFLLASTAARNSDVWMHLATGRAIANGTYRFQGDPFGQNASTWIHHAWLHDLAAYALYQPFPNLHGSLLVIVKALLVAFLAGLMVRLGSGGRGTFWSALTATLAVLALSGRLLLQPALVSAVLLAGTLAQLMRGRRLRGEGVGWFRAYAPVCMLFALWANLDEWFLLGPLTVALFLLGDVLATVANGDKRSVDVAGMGITLVVGIFACLLTPFHIHGLTLPVELGLSETTRVLKGDPVLRHLFASPFEGSYLHSGSSWNISGLAYLALVVVGLVSFAFSRDAWRSWRLPMTLAFLSLSVWSVHAVPFFVVVAAPIAALNVGEGLVRLRPDGLRRGDFVLARLGRATALLTLLGMLVASWPGWLQGAPYEMRRWVVLADPSLERAANQLAKWREDKLLESDDLGFHFSLDEANYFAYFCPAEKSLLDSRMRVTPELAADYVEVRRALLAMADGSNYSIPLKEKAEANDWRSVFREHHINHVVVYDSNPERIKIVYQRLVQNPAEWELIGLTGRAAIFSWKDPRHRVRELTFSLPLREDAYHPGEDRKAPRSWPGRGPELPSPWQSYFTVQQRSSAERDEAALLLLNFDMRGQQNVLERSIAWDAARLAGTIGAGSGAASMSVRLQQGIDLYFHEAGHARVPVAMKSKKPTLDVLAYGLYTAYCLARNDAPEEYLWLAIRAARRALRDHPDDAHAYFILGEAYLRMMRNTRERMWMEQLPFLRRLRQVQASTAFNQALLLQPDLIAAHQQLVVLYQEMGLWDLGLKHRRKVLQLTRAKGRSPSESAQEYEERIAGLQADVEQLENQLSRIENQYEINTAKYKMIDRAEEAEKQYGMGGKALEILLDSDAASFGKRGMILELQLLLSTGRVREVREWMLPDLRETIGDEVYLKNRAALSAACGDYERAESELSDLAALYDKPLAIDRFADKLSLREAIALGVANEIQQTRLDKQTATLQWPPNRFEMFRMAAEDFSRHLQQSASYTVLQGLMALECGETDRASTLFTAALKTYHGGEGLDFGGRAIAEHYVKHLSMPAK